MNNIREQKKQAKAFIKRWENRGNERQDIFQLRGVRPFLSDKFDITKHKNYKLLEDFDKKNVFDIEDYIKRKGKVKLNRNTVISRL
mgnify:FL=1